MTPVALHEEAGLAEPPQSQVAVVGGPPGGDVGEQLVVAL